MASWFLLRLLFAFDLVSPRNDYYLNMDGFHGYGPGTVRVDFGLDSWEIWDVWKGAPLKPNGIAFLSPYLNTRYVVLSEGI